MLKRRQGVSLALLPTRPAAVPGATGTITNKSTSAVRTLTSNNNGLYSAPGLEAGEYTVHIEQKGFKSVTLHALVQAGSSSAASV
jgi:hypothetical protein